MRNFAVLLAMVAGFTAIVGPAAGLLGDPPKAAQPEHLVGALCFQAFVTAAQPGAADRPPDRLDAAVRLCASLKEWLAAARMHPDAIDGSGDDEHRRFLATRCGDATAGLARYAPCRELGRPAKADALGSVSVYAPIEMTHLEPEDGVEIILPRIDIAKDSLTILVREALPPRMMVAIRTFGGVQNGGVERCRTRLTLPLKPLDRRAALDLVDKLSADKRASTAIAASLAAVADDLARITGKRIVILLTDGDETCGGDILGAIADLRASWPDLTLNVVGYDVDDEDLSDRMAGWAEAGGGGYFEASSVAELASAFASAITGSAGNGTELHVVTSDGQVVDHGTVGGDPVKLLPGTYQVEVVHDQPIVFRDVVVRAGKNVKLELPEVG